MLIDADSNTVITSTAAGVYYGQEVTIRVHCSSTTSVRWPSNSTFGSVTYSASGAGLWDVVPFKWHAGAAKWQAVRVAKGF